MHCASVCVYAGVVSDDVVQDLRQLATELLAPASDSDVDDDDT